MARGQRWKLHMPTLARHAAGNRHGVLQALRLDVGARPDPDLKRRRQLHRHRLPAGTHTRCQLVTNDASGALTLVEMGASFAIATGGVLTLTIAASPNAGSVWVRVVDEVSGAVFEQEVTSDLPAANQFLAPRLFVNNGATAADVAFDCTGVYLETDY